MIHKDTHQDAHEEDIHEDTHEDIHEDTTEDTTVTYLLLQLVRGFGRQPGHGQVMQQPRRHHPFQQGHAGPWWRENRGGRTEGENSGGVIGMLWVVL